MASRIDIDDNMQVLHTTLDEDRNVLYVAVAASSTNASVHLLRISLHDPVRLGLWIYDICPIISTFPFDVLGICTSYVDHPRYTVRTVIILKNSISSMAVDPGDGQLLCCTHKPVQLIRVDPWSDSSTCESVTEWECAYFPKSGSLCVDKGGMVYGIINRWEIHHQWFLSKIWIGRTPLRRPGQFNAQHFDMKYLDLPRCPEPAPPIAFTNLSSYVVAARSQNMPTTLVARSLGPLCFAMLSVYRLTGAIYQISGAAFGSYNQMYSFTHNIHCEFEMDTEKWTHQCFFYSARSCCLFVPSNIYKGRIYILPLPICKGILDSFTEPISARH